MEIAVVGMGCRIPGANNTEEYWRVLIGGENHVINIPKERWRDTNKSSHTRAGLVDGYKEFWDYEFHGISFYEGREMDPQQKMVLDSVYMALENAGITKKQVHGSNTSVFIGAMNNDYKGLLDGETDEGSNYQVTGGSSSILSARVSYIFNLLGTSVTVDSACSSSAVAIDLACNQLKSGNCEMAIAGGVNSILSPGAFSQLLKAGMLSPSGICHAFSDKADGYVRGEGCGIVILKPLTKALNDHDRILATIITATNQDGATVSPITAPSVQQQVANMEKIYGDYGISPDTVDYVEAHGTGTKVGDPIEIKGLGQFFKRSKSNQSLPIGSVKTNIGHLESASGVASLIKVILMHQHQTIVPTLHYDRPNRVVPLSEYNLEVVTDVRPWPSNNRKYIRSAVNCFGFGGTNCHMIVTTHLSSTSSDQRENVNSNPMIVCLSAKNPVSLERMVEDLCKDRSDYTLDDLSYTSINRRNHYKYRRSVVGSTVKEVLQNLKQLPSESNTKIFKKKKLIMVFAGAGTSWQGMCRKLLTNSDIFQSKIVEIQKLLQKHEKWDLMKKLSVNNEDFFDPSVNPILIFAVEVALFHTLTKVGIIPDAILGQSMGEVAAAVASGVLQPEQAVDIIYYRTKCLEGATGGHMFLVRGISEDKVVSVLKQFNSRACISLYYSPVSFVVSCDADLSTAIKSKLLEEEANIFFNDLKVPSAFHSHHMNDSAQRLKDILDFDTNESSNEIPIYSTVTGALVKGDEFISPNYWAKNVRDPVLFHQAVLSSYDPDKINIYLEVGPKPVLTTFLEEIFNLQESVIGIPTVNAGDDLEHVLKSIARLYNLGIDLEWKDFLNPFGQLIDVPRYQFNPKSSRFCPSFQYQKLMGVKTTDHRHRFVRPTIDDHLSFKIFLDQSEIPSIFTHKVHENNIIPGALFAEAGLAIWSLINDFYFMEPSEVSVRFLKPVSLNDKDYKMLDVSVDNSDVKTFTVSDGHIQCAVGKIQPSKSKVKTLHLDDIKNRCRDKVLSDVSYGNLKRKGFKYGIKMALLGNCVRNSYEALTEINITNLKDELNKTILHPAIIDSLIQTACAFIDNYTSTDTELYPVKISKLVVSRSPSEHMLVYTKLLKEDNYSLSFSVDLCLRNGLVVASIQEVLFRLVKFSHSTLKRFQMFSWKKLDDSKFDSASTMHTEMTKNHQSPSFLTFVADSERHRINEQTFYFISTDEERRQNQLSDFKSMTSTSSVVVIPPNYIIDDILMTGKELEECIGDIMLWLKDVLLFITDLHSSKVVVLTLNTWTKVNETKLSNFTSTNPIQRTVLGFLRSVQKEVPFHLRIVDTDEASPTIDSIWNLLHKLASPKFKSETEFILKQTNLFVCRCEPKDEDDDCLEIKIIRPRTDIELFVDEYDREFVMYRRRPLKDINDSLMLKVSTLVFPKPDLFSSHIYHELDGKKTIFSRFFLEAVGRIESGASNTDVVSCYPVQGSDSVRVPKACCCPLERFHGHYIPGMMTILVILWNLAREVKKSHVVILYSDKSEAKVVDMLCSMLAPANVIACTIRQMKDRSSIKIDQIISLVRMSNQCILDILEYFQNVDDIVTLSALVPAEIQSRFCYNSVNAKMLTDHDMFNPLRLTALLPELFRWLATTRQDTFQDIKNCMCEESTPYLGLVQAGQVVLSEASAAPLRLIPGRIISRQGSYIVVGGLTGLGWECVKWLAKEEAAVIVCFNRRVPSSEDTRKMNDLYSKHLCKVVAFSADVTNLEAVNNAMLTLKEKFPDNPLRGVIYGAAVSGDAMISGIHRQQIQSVLAPKVRGTWNIHKVTQNEDLDFFILHSSITAVLGNAGQTVYGSANAFMDGLVDLRRSNGLTAQAVNWGPLDMGMLESKDTETTRRRFFDQGYNLITKEEIGTCLEKAIISNQPQIIVADLTNKIQEADIYTKSKLKDQVASQLHSARPESSNDEAETNRMIDLNALRDTPKDKRLDILQELVLEIAQNILGSDVTLESNLQDLGIDSMNSTTLRNEIFKTTKHSIPLTLINSSNITVIILSQNVNDHLFHEDTDLCVSGKNYSENISYMERRYLKLNEWTNAYKSLHFITDFEFRNYELNFKKFREIVNMVLERNEHARTTFSKSVDGDLEGKKVIIDASHAAEIYDIQDDETRIIDELKFKKFNLSSSGPVRFIFRNKETRTRIIIVTHDVGFDKKTIAVFLGEFMKCLQYTVARDELSQPEKNPKQNKTVFEILESALERKREHLLLFWKDQLKQGIPNVSIAPDNTLKIHSGLSVVRHQLLPKDLYHRLKRVSETTVAKIIITMYQLLLGYMSSSRRVCVTLPQDVRIPIPELTDHLGCLTNNVPLFVDIPDDGVSITKFLKFNSKSIIECADYNGFFPFERLADLFPEGTPDNSLNLLLRHCVTYNDRSFINGPIKNAADHNVHLEFISIGSEHSYCESDLYINENSATGSMDLTLHLTQDMYDEKKAEEVLNNLVAMLEVDINSSTIGDLRRIVNI